MKEQPGKSATTARQAKTAKQTKKTLKHWVAVVLFSAIIIVFALWGINPSRFGENTGGVAATVNNVGISLAEYQKAVENMQNNAKIRMDQIPEAQRKEFNNYIRRQAIDGLIQSEVFYQAAEGRGVAAPDAEVRDYILKVPFLIENGRFSKDRYRMFLQSQGFSTQDFEREIRKELVQQKMQQLFVGSASPTREELKRSRELSSQKLNLRFVEISKEDLKKPGFISDADVAAFEKSGKPEIEKYYKDNAVEFTNPEKVQARHILIRIDDKRNDAAALKMAQDLKKQLNAKNFAALATKNSDDPGSKIKGGDLGEFERGRMVPEFETAAFGLAPGQISEPVKTPYGYHIIMVEKKTPAGTTPLEKAEPEIARKLLVRSKESEVLAKTKALVEKGDKKEVDAFVQKAGLKWTETGEFDLATPSVPKLGESREVVRAVLKHGRSTGLVPTMVEAQGRHLIVDVTSWKETPEKAPENEGLDRQMAYRKSSDSIESWFKEVEASANIQRNASILQR